MTDSIKKLFQNIKELVFTVKCPYCGKVIKKTEYACDKCKAKFPQKSIQDYAIGGYKCAVAFPYDGIFKKAVLNFKFRNRGEYAKQLAFPVVQAIIEIFGDEIKNFDFITAVPMHKNRVKARGYNQSELIARQCSMIMNIPYCEALVKFKENKTQHSIKAIERAQNVKGVYKAIDKNILANKNVLIIDDIITTGNTLGECARVLTKAGCKKVSCATVCCVIIK